VRTITAVTATQITVSTGVSYYHFGDSVSPTINIATYQLDMRTEIGLLTRKIKIVGSDEDSYGGNLLVTGFMDTFFETGEAKLYGVELVNMG